ncbi:lactonase family protein [Streptomyces tagetis]|uniref:Lactonase family protein n=1 Tax=Streptomyces tagetis TaxID=2820809 RepID=A0A940XKD6_9ACTN|nr:lactonase family protein [Streptomyces sp. RG38]MBQ0826250.1 lactonase family protein [Streptomyces sp. RG38]
MSGEGWSRRRFVGLAWRTAAVAAVLPAAGCGEARDPEASGSGTPAPRASGGAAGRDAAPSGPRPLFLGTYTSAQDGGEGVGLAAYDPATGEITATGTLTGVADPSFLAVHPDGRTVYAVGEREEGTVTAFRADGPRVLGSRSAGGSAPCHLSVHPDGRWLLSAHYGSGSVAVHPIDASGALGERAALVRHTSPPPGPGQAGPHAHQVVTGPGGHVLAVDLGTDTVYTYRLDGERGTLTETSRARVRPGTGPRHLAFHPGGRHAYLVGELDDTVTVCGYDPQTGRLDPGTPQSTGTAADAAAGAATGTNHPAQLLVTADESHAYLANRGRDTLTRYAVEDGGARLRLVDEVPAGGEFPRQIAFSPDGALLFAANQRSGTVSVFHVDRAGGRLRPAGAPFASPVAVCALPL